MERIVNIGLQILPQSDNMHPYDIIDETIGVIRQSGVKHKVCPMETVFEGRYDEVMKVVDAAIRKAYSLSDKVFVNIRMQLDKTADVSMDEKLSKYE